MNPINNEPPKDDNKKKPIRRRRSKKRDRTAERVEGQIPAPPLSAYNFFFRAERLGGSDGKRDEQPLDNPNEESTKYDTKGPVDFKTMTKSIGLKWRELPAAEKLAYEELAKQDLNRYRRELAEYNEEVIRSTKIGRASLEGRMKPTPQNHAGDDDSKPPSKGSRVAEQEIDIADRFPGLSQQFARPPFASGSLPSHQQDQLLRQQVAENVLVQHLLSDIAHTSGGVFDHSSSMISQLLRQNSNASDINDRLLDSASVSGALYEHMIQLHTSQMGERLGNILSSSPTAFHSQPTGIQEALWLYQAHPFSYPGQLPTLADILISQQNNQNALAQLQAAQQFQPSMVQNANHTRDQQTILQHLRQQISDAELARAIASNSTSDTHDLLRQLEEEERRRQQR